MVFLSLSVKNIKQSKDFYVGTLGLFKLVDSNRITCDSGVDLIIDFYQVGTDEHVSVFEQKEHVMSNLAIGYDKAELKLCDNLEVNLFDFDLQNCIAGSFLRLKDPSGNKITISHQKCRGIS